MRTKGAKGRAAQKLKSPHAGLQSPAMRRDELDARFRQRGLVSAYPSEAHNELLQKVWALICILAELENSTNCGGRGSELLGVCTFGCY
jgi:hypothetical protein